MPDVVRQTVADAAMSAMRTHRPIRPGAVTCMGCNGWWSDEHVVEHVASAVVAALQARA